VSLNVCWRKDGSVSCLKRSQHIQLKYLPSTRILFDNCKNVALSLRQAHGMVSGGFAGVALSLVRGWVDGGLLRDNCRRRVGVGGGSHGSGECFGRRAAAGGIGWEEDALRVKPAVLRSAGEEAAAEGECTQANAPTEMRQENTAIIRRQ
jgi:hypothetical protein